MIFLCATWYRHFIELLLQNYNETEYSTIFFKKYSNLASQQCKIITIYIVNTYTRAFRKKRFFICFTSKFQGWPYTFDRGVYIFTYDSYDVSILRSQYSCAYFQSYDFLQIPF